MWLALSPGRRRLRFSFQFNDVKDRDRLSPAPLFSAGGRRRRLSIDRPLSCQPVFSDFLAGPGFPGNKAPVSQEFGRKNRLGPPRGFPQVRDDSIEVREHTHLEAKIKRLVGVGPVSRWVCARRRRLSSWRPFPRQLIVIQLLPNRRHRRHGQRRFLVGFAQLSLGRTGFALPVAGQAVAGV